MMKYAQWESPRKTCLTAYILLLGLCLAASAVEAQTYSSSSTTFGWIDASTHNRVGYNTTPYKFNTCATTPPTLDDTISDSIPISFTFTYGTTGYTQVKIDSNGRVQFNNNSCTYGTVSVGPPQTYPYGYPDGSMNNTMKVFGVDLDPTNGVDYPSYPTTCNGYANCYVSWASIGTAPNRQFVVTWRNVPEWVSYTNTSGSFDLQVILNENGTFIYQYGTISHGGTGTAQIGWQLSTSDYAVITFGASAEPPPNTAIIFFKPSTIATYRFEEGAWTSGGTGQILDASGNNLSGMAVGRAQATANGYICRGANIPANTSGATLDAVRSGVNISSASLNMLGTGTVTFWYKSNSAWSGAGAQSAQLLDATSVNGQWFYLTKKASGTLYFGVMDSTGTLRSVETPAQTFAANTWVNIAITWNFNGLAPANSDQLNIFINAAAPTVSSFTSSGTVTAQAGLLYFGDNPLGIADSNGSVNSANGVIDEVTIYNSELNASQVSTNMTASHSCSTYNLHHLEIQHASGSGLTCAASPITIRACQNTACSSLYIDGVSGIITAAGAPTVNWDGGSGGASGSSFAIAPGSSSTVKNIQLSTAGSVTLGIASIDPPATNSTTCNFGSPSCTFTAYTAGFIFSNSTTGSSYTIPTQVAGTATAVNALYLRAVQASTTNAAVCTPAIISQSNVPVSISYSCNDPTTCQSGNLVTINTTAVPSSGGSVNLDFDVNGSAPITVRYDDVGRITLAANKTLTPFGGATSVTLTGNSNAFVVKPAGFTLSNIKCTTYGPSSCAPTLPSPGNNPAAATYADPAFIQAGQNFAVTVTAKTSTGTATPNYGKETTPEGVKLSAILVLPLGGASPTLNNPTTFGNFTNGVATGTTFSWSEVGIIQLTPSVGDGSYLDTGDVTGTTSGNVGRFIPDHFTLTTSSITPGNGTFSYMNQPFGVTVNIEARNSGNTKTANYTGLFAKGSVTFSAENANDGTDRAARLSGLTGSWSQGAYAIDTPSAQFTRNTTPDGPYDTLVLGTTVTDADGPLLQYFNENPSTTATDTSCLGATVTGCTHKSIGTTKVRFGRLWVGNAYGSEKFDLTVPYELQYWNGRTFIKNTDDSLTAFTAANVGLANYQGGLSTTNLGTGHILVSLVSSGAGTMTLTKPSPTATGSVDLFVNLGSTGLPANCPGYSSGTSANLAYLSGNWCGSGYDRDPVIRATFGIQGNNLKRGTIYLRENF